MWSSFCGLFLITRNWIDCKFIRPVISFWLNFHGATHSLKSTRAGRWIINFFLIWEQALCLGYNRLIIHCLEAFTTGHTGRDTVFFFSCLRPVRTPQVFFLSSMKCIFEVRQRKIGKLWFLGNPIVRHFSSSGGSHRIGRVQVSGRVSVLDFVDPKKWFFGDLAFSLLSWWPRSGSI